MSKQSPSLPPCWKFYADQADRTHFGRAGDIGCGREELLWETLAIIEFEAPFTDDCRQRLERLAWNRAKKYRRVRLQLAAHRPIKFDNPVGAAEVADSIRQVRGKLSGIEWDVEWRLANGETFAQVAPDYGLSAGALKVRAGRWRARVRKRTAHLIQE
jgi:hypothetical protein